MRMRGRDYVQIEIQNRDVVLRGKVSVLFVRD